MNRITLSYLYIILAMSIVGSSVVASKMIVLSLPLWLATGMRFLIATIILVPLLLIKEGKFPVVTRKDGWSLFLQCFAGVFMFNIFMLYGLKFTTASEGGIITSTIPAVVGLIAFLFLKEKLSMLKIVGILLAITGTMAVQLLGEFTPDSRGALSWLGNLLVFASVVCEALFIILGKSVSNRFSPLAISTAMSVIGLLLFAPFAAVEAASFDFAALSLQSWLLIIYFGVVVTVIAFLLMYKGLTNVPASTAGVLTGLIPITSLILSAVLLKEQLTWVHFTAIVCVLGGITFIAYGDKKVAITATAPPNIKVPHS
ncbi:DMT family transporter [Paenibacillus sp. 481]|uniref:DMT family transporter n=1 Tax=Paenibacillus sp. 481 TaxID=2835869 RepID=UPI001E40B659|nr:DMT family transporter [Paenibacillus sp. 481]UHA72195.1 DMT family transporter [Paenibacillus sp. 481]